MWSQLRAELPPSARAWWDENREPLTRLGYHEISDTLRALGHGLHEARIEIVARMSPDQWVAYRDHVGYMLDVTKRRAKLFEALDDLSLPLASLISRQAIQRLAD